ncbi:allene oxide cyclase barrel-like domain-containing protein [Streptomyces sp. NPDC002990]
MPHYRSHRVLAATAAVCAVLATSAFTSPSPSQPARSDKRLHWIGVEETSTQTPTARVGDIWSVYRTLYEAKDGKPGRRIGESSSQCSVVHVTANELVSHCHGVAQTREGSINIGSMQTRTGPGPHSWTAAVLGGTGAYRGATGEATLTRHDKYTLFDIDLD